MGRMSTVMLVSAVALVAACSDGDDAGSDDRTSLSVEADGVRAEVADCFVVDVNGEHRYQTTIEVHNDSDRDRSTAVTIVADLGRGGTSDAIDVPAGASDAWAVTAEAPTDDPIGDVECSAFITAVELELDS